MAKLKRCFLIFLLITCISEFKCENGKRINIPIDINSIISASDLSNFIKLISNIKNNNLTPLIVNNLNNTSILSYIPVKILSVVLENIPLQNVPDILSCTISNDKNLNLSAILNDLIPLISKANLTNLISGIVSSIGKENLISILSNILPYVSANDLNKLLMYFINDSNGIINSTLGPVIADILKQINFEIDKLSVFILNVSNEIFYKIIANIFNNIPDYNLNNIISSVITQFPNQTLANLLPNLISNLAITELNNFISLLIEAKNFNLDNFNTSAILLTILKNIPEQSFNQIINNINLDLPIQNLNNIISNIQANIQGFETLIKGLNLTELKYTSILDIISKLPNYKLNSVISTIAVNIPIQNLASISFSLLQSIPLNQINVILTDISKLFNYDIQTLISTYLSSNTISSLTSLVYGLTGVDLSKLDYSKINTSAIVSTIINSIPKEAFDGFISNLKLDLPVQNLLNILSSLQSNLKGFIDASLIAEVSNLNYAVIADIINKLPIVNVNNILKSIIDNVPFKNLVEISTSLISIIPSNQINDILISISTILNYDIQSFVNEFFNSYLLITLDGFFYSIIGINISELSNLDTASILLAILKNIPANDFNSFISNLHIDIPLQNLNRIIESISTNLNGFITIINETNLAKLNYSTILDLVSKLPNVNLNNILISLIQNIPLTNLASFFSSFVYIIPVNQIGSILSEISTIFNTNIQTLLINLISNIQQTIVSNLGVEDFIKIISSSFTNFDFTNLLKTIYSNIPLINIANIISFSIQNIPINNLNSIFSTLFKNVNDDVFNNILTQLLSNFSTYDLIIKIIASIPQQNLLNIITSIFSPTSTNSIYNLIISNSGNYNLTNIVSFIIVHISPQTINSLILCTITNIPSNNLNTILATIIANYPLDQLLNYAKLIADFLNSLTVSTSTLLPISTFITTTSTFSTTNDKTTASTTTSTSTFSTTTNNKTTTSTTTSTSTTVKPVVTIVVIIVYNIPYNPNFKNLSSPDSQELISKHKKFMLSTLNNTKIIDFIIISIDLVSSSGRLASDQTKINGNAIYATESISDPSLTTANILTAIQNNTNSSLIPASITSLSAEVVTTTSTTITTTPTTTTTTTITTRTTSTKSTANSTIVLSVVYNTPYDSNYANLSSEKSLSLINSHKNYLFEILKNFSPIDFTTNSISQVSSSSRIVAEGRVGTTQTNINGKMTFGISNPITSSIENAVKTGSGSPYTITSASAVVNSVNKSNRIQSITYVYFICFFFIIFSRNF